MIGRVVHAMTPGVGGITRHRFAWTSGAAGTAEIRLNGVEAILVEGRLLYATTCPDAGAPPTDNYDIYLYDQFDNDVAQGRLLNRDNATAEIAAIYDPLAGGYKYALIDTTGPLRLRIDAAGDTKSGMLCLYIHGR
jgi:hypothetical protein